MAGAGRRRRWRPRVEPPGLRFAPRRDDRYAVVDDIESGVAVLVSSPWPDVDQLGHLVFGADVDSQDFPLAALQRAVDRQRNAAGQPAPERALRVGDVFWVRVPAGDGAAAGPARWRILDVTQAARRAARAALLVAASPALRTGGPPPAPGAAGRGEEAAEAAAVVDAAEAAAGQPPASGAAQAAV